jgi:hypothetical protein
MACIRKTTKREVLQRALKLLEDCNCKYKNRVFVMAGNELPPNIKDHDLLTVSLTGGQFAYGEQVGGGEHVVPYQGTLRVSLWHTCRTDRQGTDRDVVLATGAGLFDLQLDLLRALLGSLLPGPPGTTDEPLYDPILTQCLYAISDTEASRSSDGVFGKIPTGDMAQAVLSTDFGIDFLLSVVA